MMKKIALAFALISGFSMTAVADDTATTDAPVEQTEDTDAAAE